MHMNSLGLNKKVQKRYSQTCDDVAEEIGKEHVREEIRSLNEVLNNISVSVFNKVYENDQVSSFSELYERIDNIQNDDSCMKYLRTLFDTFGYKPDCKSFSDFVRKQMEVSHFTMQL